MTLEDFEKSLAEKQRSRDPREKSQKSHKDREERHHQSHHQHPAQEDGEEHRHRHKRRRHSSSEEDSVQRRRHKHSRDDEQPIKQKSRRHRNDDEKDALGEVKNSGEAGKIRKDSVVDDQVLPTLLKRDSWMEPPIGNEIEFVPRKKENLVEVTGENLRIQFEADLCQEELKHLIDNPAAEEVIESVSIEPVQEDVKYIFGDAGSEWRMRKLKNVFKQAEQSKKPLEEVALNQYGDLRAFDDAREEEIELDRRQTYGESYIGKEKPSGELFQERKRNPEIHKDSDMIDENLPELHVIKSEEKSVPQATILDQTALNRLKAKMMKAKLRGGQEAAKLEAEYDEAMSNAIMGENGNVVVLGKMQNRMLAGGRGTEVKAVDTKRGRERGLVEENEDMSIEDMIREERRNRGQQGGEGLILAERIAKDGKFTVSQISQCKQLTEVLTFHRMILNIWKRMRTSLPKEYRNQRSISRTQLLLIFKKSTES